MNKNVVILGSETGASSLARGLKQFPIDICVVVSACDDGTLKHDAIKLSLKIFEELIN